MADFATRAITTATLPTQNGVCAIYQIMVGWKTYEYKYYNGTDELPNPRPTQPKKKYAKSGIWATFSHRKYFSWVGIDFM